jgi:tRNA nucleotidyltransferase (CCA-adding enzyme)
VPITTRSHTSSPPERASGGQIRQNGSQPSWEHFSHDADIGLVGIGPTVTPVELVCRAPSDELLLVEWLNALIYEMAVRSMLFGDFIVEIRDGDLHATARGERVDLERHEPAVEIKGATMTALRVGLVARGWRAQCVVDV